MFSPIPHRIPARIRGAVPVQVAQIRVKNPKKNPSISPQKNSMHAFPPEFSSSVFLDRRRKKLSGGAPPEDLSSCSPFPLLALAFDPEELSELKRTIRMFKAANNRKKEKAIQYRHEIKQFAIVK